MTSAPTIAAGAAGEYPIARSPRLALILMLGQCGVAALFDVVENSRYRGIDRGVLRRLEGQQRGQTRSKIRRAGSEPFQRNHRTAFFSLSSNGWIAARLSL